MTDTKQEHSISRYCAFGELEISNSPTFAETKLKQLYDEAESILDQTLHAVISVKNKNFSEYKPEFAHKKKKEALLEVRLKPTFRTLRRVFFGVFLLQKAKYDSKLCCWALHASLPFAPCGSAFSLNPWRVVPITVCLAAAH